MAIVIFAITLSGTALSSHYIASVGWIFICFFLSSGFALTAAVQFAVFYVALEPYVRRAWPEILISWTRLVSGGWKDPLVGRDVLIGILFGVGMTIAEYIRLALPYWFPLAGISAGGPSSLDLREGSAFLGDMAIGIFGVYVSVAFLAIVFLVAKTTRSKVVGVVVGTLLIVGTNLVGENFSVEVPVACILGVSSVTLLMRVGLLPLVVGRCVWGVLDARLITSDLSRWYAWRGLTEMAVVFALALYGFKVALAGKPIFGGAFED